MSEQSPFDLFGSSYKKQEKKKIPKEDKPQPLQQQQQAVKPRQSVEAPNVKKLEESLAELKNKQEMIQKAVEMMCQKCGFSQQQLSQKKIDVDQLPIEVKKKLEKLVRQIAVSAGEKRVPAQYRRMAAKPLTDKERKNKLLGAKKKWMPMQ